MIILKTLCLQRRKEVERVKGIEPSSQPWEGHILPLNHTRRRRLGKFYQTAAWLATALPGLNRRLQFADGFAQPRGDDFQPFRRGDFSVHDVAHIKTVDGRAALGHDARGGDVQIQFRERL